jgi:hypothetical protein
MMGLGIEVEIAVSGLAVHFVSQRAIRWEVAFLQEPHGITSWKMPFFMN